MLTIRDVANYCGVSVSTVSRVLNQHPDVSQKVRAKVEAAIADLHYIPNDSARSLVREQSDEIGLIVRGGSNPFFAEVIHGIETRTREANYSLIPVQLNSTDDEVLTGATLARAKKLKGLIFLGGRFDYQPQDIAAIGIPFVCCSFTNRFTDLPAEQYSSVSIDDEAEAYQATKYLIGLGHERIAILLLDKADRSISELRYRGYCRALQEKGIAIQADLVREIGRFSMTRAYEEIQKVVAERVSFSALFAISDGLALAALKALHDAGVAVPQACSILSIDGIKLSEYSIPTLSTLVQPKKEMGEEAVRILLELIAGRAVGCNKNQHLTLKTVLRTGETAQAYQAKP